MGHKTSLTLPLYIEVSVPCQEGERSCIYVLEVSIFASFNDFPIGFLEMFRHCGNLVFYFITDNVIMLIGITYIFADLQ